MNQLEMCGAVDRVVELAHATVKQQGIAPSDEHVERLRVQLHREVADWAGGLWTPETAGIPIATEPRYECNLGDCEDGDYIHDAESLYFMPYQVKDDEVYEAGWYCGHCISNEVGDHLTDHERGALTTLAQELRRRAEEGLAA